VPAGSGEATGFPRNMARVEGCRTEHQGSERCDGVDVNSGKLISASQFIHLFPPYMGRAVAQFVEALHYKLVRIPIVSFEFFFHLFLPTL